mgnify:CR=1 FL=1
MADKEDDSDLIYVLAATARRLSHTKEKMDLFLEQMKATDSTTLGHLAYLAKC